MNGLSSRRRLGVLFCVVLIFLSLFSCPVFAEVSSSAGANSQKQAMNNLQTYVYGKLSQNEYTLEEGGTVSGSDLFTGKPTEGYELNDSEFQKLTSKEQGKVVEDIAASSNAAVDDEGVKGVTEDTVSTWWKDLQTHPGVGSKFMNEILKNTKPDFVTANKIYAPFAGPVGVVLGLLAIVIMSFLGIVIVLDIAYIVIPPVRLMVSDGDSRDGKIEKSKLVSNDAIYAVKVAEENDGGDGNKKQALGIYFKRRVIALILLGICLLYLVQGQIYTLVSIILDMVNGFLGF